MVKVKIDGITSLRDAWAAVDAGADALGFVFYSGSPRNITPAESRAIVKTLPAFVASVGVFVDERPQTVREIWKECALSMVQLHGNETQAAIHASRAPVIKAFRVRLKKDIMRAVKFEVPMYLFDAYRRGVPGGTGVAFKWDLLKKVSLPVPFMLAGGLGPDNVRRAVRIVRPYGVDVSGGVERAPGVKDHVKMREFVRAAKEVK